MKSRFFYLALNLAALPALLIVALWQRYLPSGLPGVALFSNWPDWAFIAVSFSIAAYAMFCLQRYGMRAAFKTSLFLSALTFAMLVVLSFQSGILGYVEALMLALISACLWLLKCPSFLVFKSNLKQRAGQASQANHYLFWTGWILLFLESYRLSVLTEHLASKDLGGLAWVLTLFIGLPAYLFAKYQFAHVGGILMAGAGALYAWAFLKYPEPEVSGFLVLSLVISVWMFFVLSKKLRQHV